MKEIKKYIALLCIMMCITNPAMSVLADSIDTVPAAESEIHPGSEEGAQNVEEETSATSSVDSEKTGSDSIADNGDLNESETNTESSGTISEQENESDENQAGLTTESTDSSSADDQVVEEENQEEAMVGSALTISYNNGYPVLEAEDAKVFLAFLYNDSSILQQDLTDNPYYNLLIGNHSVFESYEEMDLYIYDFSVFVRDSMRTQESSSTENVTKLSSKLEKYLEKRMGGMSNLDEEIVNEYKGWLNKQLRKGLSNIFCNQLANLAGIYLSENTFENLKLGIDTVNDIKSIPSKVQEFSENVVAAVDGALYVLQNEFKGRSMYFNSYLSNRPNYRSADDLIFQTIMDYNALAARENSAYSKLLDSISGITGKDSWSNHIETLNHFAEYFYQLEQASFSTDPGTWSGSQGSESGEEQSVTDDVTVDFDAETGAVTLYSNGGTLWEGWISRAGLRADAIKSIEVASTSRKVHMPEDSSDLFRNCSNLITLDLSYFDTSNVTEMDGLFEDCSSLTTLDLSGFDTSNVTTMQAMFSGCSNLTTLDLSSFDTSNVEDMNSMFSDCRSLTTLNLSGFDTSNVTDMGSMFLECRSLATLDLSGFDTSNVTEMHSMFFECRNLTMLDLSGFDTSDVTDMGSMFFECISLTTLDLSGFDTSNVTTMAGMFEDCSALTLLDLSNFNTSNVTSMSFMFGCCSNLTSLDLSGFDTSNVTDMGQMFLKCSSLPMLDLSNFDTSNVTYMPSMFENCHFTTVNLSSFNTSNVTNMGDMFSGCINLTTLDLSSFNTSNVKYMDSMFSGCSNLTTLDLSSFNTLNVTWMHEMFEGCSNLATLDLSNFDVSKVVYMNNMFSGCSNLTTLDLSSFDTSKVKNTKAMFYGCNSLAILKTPRINTIEEVKLPITMYDNTGTQYTSLPILSKSITLTNSNQSGNPDESEHDNDSGSNIYLENLKRVEYDQYTGNEGDSFVYTIGKHKYTRGATDINGNTYSHGIECWVARWNYTAESSWAYSVYELDKAYSQLSGQVVLIKSYNTTNFDTTLYFYGDDKLLASYDLSPNSIPFDFSINLTGVDKLKIYVKDNKSVKGGTSFGLTDCRLTHKEDLSIDALFPIDNDRSVDKFTSFGIVWDQPIQYTGTGSAYLYEYDSDQLVQTIPLMANDYENSSILSHGSNILARNLLLLNFDSNLLEQNTHYYILIDAGALEFYTYDEGKDDYVALGITSEGISAKDEWDFTTNNYQYMKFSNPTERVPLSICSVLFRPITAKKFYDEEKGTHGICYGMCYTAGAYDRGYAQLLDLCAGRDLSQLDINASSEGVPYSLLEYIQLAYMYQYTEKKQDEYYAHKDKYDIVYNAVANSLNGGTPVQIAVSDTNDNGHALLPLSIIKDDGSEVEVLVYDCNKPSPVNDILLSSYISTLKFYRSGNEVTGFSYGDYTSISFEEIDTTLDRVASMSEPVSWSEQKTLIVSGLKIPYDGFRKIFGIDDEQEHTNNGKYYYWTDNTSLDLPASEMENDISMTDGYKEIHVVSNAGTSVNIDLDSQSATVTSDKNEEGSLAISLSTVEGESDIKNITLSGNANSQISVMSGSDGIVLTSTDSNFNDMSVTVDGNDVKLNTADFTSSTNSVTVNVDEDNTITVTEDTDEDGENETTLVQKKADAAIVYGASLTLEGQIGVNIKLLLPESIVSDPDSYVVMEYNGEKEVSVTTPVSEAAMDSGRYVFTCPVAVKEINDPVSIRVYHGDGSQVELVKGETSRIPVEENCFRYAVSDYIASKKTKTTAIGELTRTMSDFGAAARLYFNYEAEGSVIEADLSGITADDLLDYKMELTPQAAEGIKIYGASLMLESETGINIKFSGTDDTFDINNYTFTVDGSEVAPTAAADGRYQINIGNIAAKDLDKMYTVTVTDSAGNSQSIRYGALSYAYSKLNSSSSGESIRNLSKCLYLYNQAANTYFND